MVIIIINHHGNPHPHLTDLHILILFPVFQVPDLVVFWILSTFIQLPIQLYIAINFDYFSGVFLCAVLIQVVFIVVELLIVTPAINVKSRQQIEQFKMAELIARNAY